MPSVKYKRPAGSRNFFSAHSWFTYSKAGRKSVPPPPRSSSGSWRGSARPHCELGYPAGWRYQPWIGCRFIPVEKFSCPFSRCRSPQGTPAQFTGGGWLVSMTGPAPRSFCSPCFQRLDGGRFPYTEGRRCRSSVELVRVQLYFLPQPRRTGAENPGSCGGCGWRLLPAASGRIGTVGLIPQVSSVCIRSPIFCHVSGAAA